MALPTTYNTGTVTIAANDTAVTGQGTTWQTSGIQAGDMFMAAGLSVPIASVNSNTSITLADAWPGAARAAASYRIQFTPDATRVLASTRAVLDALTNGVLYAIAGLTTAADKIAYFTGAGTAALTSFTAFARSLVGAADAATARTTLQLGTAALRSIGTDGRADGNFVPILSGSNIWTNPQQIKRASLAAYIDIDAVDGVSAAYIAGRKAGNYRWSIFLGDTTAEPGDGSGSNFTLSRYDDAGNNLGAVMTANRKTGLASLYAGLTVTGGPLTISSTSSIAFGGAAAATTRTNLGLGSAAVVNTGTSGAAVPMLNAVNTWVPGQTFGTGAGGTNVVLNSANGNSNSLFGSKAGLNAWCLILGNGTSMSGSDVGADLNINSYKDDGTFKGTPVTITRATGVVSFTAPPKVPSFTVSTLPSAAANPQGVAYVSNGTANKRLAISDGTDWRFPDGAIVS